MKRSRQGGHRSGTRPRLRTTGAIFAATRRAAADELHVTHGAVSRAIRNLRITSACN